MATAITPMILSGGSGTRLWPFSRSDKPKQFLSFGDGPSLIERTMQRCSGEGFASRLIIVSAENHQLWVADALQKQGREADVLLEPMRRDSCAAIVAGALAAMANDPESLVLVVAADHLIPDASAFRSAVRDAADAAEMGWIVTFGIAPTEPATGYGYIAASPEPVGRTCRKLAMFKEKPDRTTAATYIQQGYLWNSGNFLFKAKHFLAEAERLVPQVYQAMAQALAGASKDGGATRLETTAFATSPQISIDYAIMEKTGKAAVAPVTYAWSDIGSWDAVAKIQQNSAGEGRTIMDGSNVLTGNAVTFNSSNTTILTDNRLVTTVGTRDVIVVSTGDAVLVAHKGETEHVKELVDKLKAMGAPQIDRSPALQWAWGRMESLESADGHELSRVTLAPGQKWPFSPAAKAKESWFVVSGQVTVRLNGQSQTLEAGAHFPVQIGEQPDVENPGPSDSVLFRLILANRH